MVEPTLGSITASLTEEIWPIGFHPFLASRAKGSPLDDRIKMKVLKSPACLLALDIPKTRPPSRRRVMQVLDVMEGVPDGIRPRAYVDALSAIMHIPCLPDGDNLANLRSK